MDFLIKLGWLIYLTPLLAFIISLAVTALVFVAVDFVPTTFLTSLLTVDSFSVAVVGFVFPLLTRTFRVEETLSKFESAEELLKPKDKEVTNFPELLARAIAFAVTKVLSFGIAAAVLLAPLLFISPFALSILFVLTAMLRSGSDAVLLSATAFLFTAFGFLFLVGVILILVWLLWHLKLGDLSGK